MALEFSECFNVSRRTDPRKGKMFRKFPSCREMVDCRLLKKFPNFFTFRVGLFGNVDPHSCRCGYACYACLRIMQGYSTRCGIYLAGGSYGHNLQDNSGYITDVTPHMATMVKVITKGYTQLLPHCSRYSELLLFHTWLLVLVPLFLQLLYHFSYSKSCSTETVAIMSKFIKP